MINEKTLGDLNELRARLVATHAERFGTTDDLVVGLQLTHSGRFARPDPGEGLKPRIAYRHPILDKKFGITDDSAVMTDDEIDRLVTDFIKAARLAHQAGFDFVDVKHCHGYLGHELLSAIDRPGKYGGSFENRTRFLRDVVAGIRTEVPDLDIGVRLSAFDWIPFRPGADQIGEPVDYAEDYRYAFGGAPNGTGIDLTEPRQFLDLLNELNIELLCITAGSPYYVPHISARLISTLGRVPAAGRPISGSGTPNSGDRAA
jgi:2,4-dienoyl-CoA reductase-like NADH-dependent reductase (Old Yellow Enzyme family)